MQWKKLLKDRRAHIILISIITILVYLNSLGNGFVWDDPTFITDWDAVKNVRNIPALVAGELPADQEGVFRPVRGALYPIFYFMYGENPMLWHLQAIIIHLACTLLLYLIVSKLAKNNLIAFIASILFGVHPIHTESISYISASIDMVAVIFYFAAFYLYVRAREEKTYALYITSIILATISFFTYELALSLPLVIVFYELIFSKWKTGIWMKKAKSISPFFISAVVFVILRSVAQSITARGGYLAGSFYHAMLASIKALSMYLMLLLFPKILSVDHELSPGIHSYKKEVADSAALSQSLFEPHVLIAVLAIAVLVIVAYKVRKKHPLVSFSIGWVFLALLPVMNIVPGATLFSERYAYIASAGFCMLTGYLIYAIGKSKLRRKTLIALFIAMLLFFSSQTVTRNADWKDDITLWSSTVDTSPGSRMAQLNIGAAYYSVGNLEIAKMHLLKAIAIDSDYAMAHNNLGNILLDQDDLSSAVEEYQKAVMLDPSFAKARVNLGHAYHVAGMFDEALLQYQIALEIRPLPDAYNKIGLIYYQQKNYDTAIAQYNEAIALSPYYADAYNNLGAAYRKIGDLDSAVLAFQKAIAMDHTIPEAHYNLALIFKSRDNCTQAIPAFQTALTYEPSIYQAHNAIGECLLSLGKIEGAKIEFQKALEIEPDYEKAKANLDGMS